MHTLDGEPASQSGPPALCGYKLGKTTKPGTTIACDSRFRTRFGHTILGGEAAADKEASKWIDEQRASDGSVQKPGPPTEPTEAKPKRANTVRTPEEVEAVSQMAITFANGTGARRVDSELWKSFCSRRMKELILSTLIVGRPT